VPKGELSSIGNLPDAVGMSHRYRVGDLVFARSLAVPPGPYVITRLLPPVAGEPHYHGRHTVDGHHRALMEEQLRPAGELTPGEAAIERKEKRRAGR
jgi:hypothetical protein